MAPARRALHPLALTWPTTSTLYPLHRRPTASTHPACSLRHLPGALRRRDRTTPAATAGWACAAMRCAQLWVSRIEQRHADEAGRADDFEVPDLGLRFRLGSPRRSACPPPSPLWLHHPYLSGDRVQAPYNAWATGIAGGQRQLRRPHVPGGGGHPELTCGSVMWPYSNPLRRRSSNCARLSRRSPHGAPCRWTTRWSAPTSWSAFDEESPMDKIVSPSLVASASLHHHFDAAAQPESDDWRRRCIADAWTCALYVQHPHASHRLRLALLLPRGEPTSPPPAPSAPSGSLPVAAGAVGLRLLPHWTRPADHAPVGSHVRGGRGASSSALHCRSPLSACPPGRRGSTSACTGAAVSAYRSRALADTGVRPGWGEVNASRYHLPLAYRLSRRRVGRLT